MTTLIRRTRRRLGATLTDLARDLQDHPAGARSHHGALAARGLFASRQRQIETLARLARAVGREDGPAYQYLDLCIGHLAQGEREAVLSTPDDDPILDGPELPLLPRIIPHGHGAWVNVPLDLDAIDLRRLRAAGYWSLAAVLAFAAKRGYLWINFDEDAADIPELPFYWDERLRLHDAVARRARRGSRGARPFGRGARRRCAA